MELERFWNLFPEKEALSDLTREQSLAVFRLLMVGSFADDEVTTPERISLAQALTRLPFFDETNWRMLDDARGVQVLADLHARYSDPDDFPVLMSEISDALDDRETRVLALRMVALFVQPDGFAQQEYDFCLMIGQALGLEDDDEVAGIIEDAWDFAGQQE